jgi:hypothetical protein
MQEHRKQSSEHEGEDNWKATNTRFENIFETLM